MEAMESVSGEGLGISPLLATDVLTIVGWLWSDPLCKTQYGPQHANTWARMLDRHITIPHRFILMTDQPDADYDRRITPIPLWDDWRQIKNEQWGTSKPQCYVRLKAFSAEAEEILGKRFVSIDLDCVALANLDDLFTREEDFLIYRRPVQMLPMDEINPYQASMWMMTAGARRQVWDEFEGGKSIRLSREFMGTDQAWLHEILGRDETGWITADGVYGWGQIRENPQWKHKPPPDAKIIFFYGNQKPWQFASIDKPICEHCGHDPKIKPPYDLQFNRKGAADEWQWIPRNYR